MLIYRIFYVYFQYLKCLLTSFLMPTYNILKIYNRPIQLKIVSQKERLSQQYDHQKYLLRKERTIQTQTQKIIRTGNFLTEITTMLVDHSTVLL